jgi:hypothetical protein
MDIRVFVTSRTLGPIYKSFCALTQQEVIVLHLVGILSIECHNRFQICTLRKGITLKKLMPLLYGQNFSKILINSDN